MNETPLSDQTRIHPIPGFGFIPLRVRTYPDKVLISAGECAPIHEDGGTVRRTAGVWVFDTVNKTMERKE